MKSSLIQKCFCQAGSFVLLTALLWLFWVADAQPPVPTPRAQAAPRAATTNGFDSFAAGARLTNQIAGVTFPDGAFVRTAASLGIGARSAPNVLQKDCFEFDEAPFRIQFSAAQGLVRVYMGNRD